MGGTAKRVSHVGGIYPKRGIYRMGEWEASSAGLPSGVTGCGRMGNLRCGEKGNGLDGAKPLEARDRSKKWRTARIGAGVLVKMTNC
jgi:hypothetical protein